MGLESSTAKEIAGFAFNLQQFVSYRFKIYVPTRITYIMVFDDLKLIQRKNAAGVLFFSVINFNVN